MEIVIKRVDCRGRIIIPKEWRDKYVKQGKIIMKIIGDKIEIIPYRDITEYFDAIETDVDSRLSNWNNVKRELMKTD